MTYDSDSTDELPELPFDKYLSEYGQKLYYEFGLFELPHHSMVEKWHCVSGRELWRDLNKYVFFTRYLKRFVGYGTGLTFASFLLMMVLIAIHVINKTSSSLILYGLFALNIIGFCIALVPFFMRALMRRTSREFKEDVLQARLIVSQTFVDLLANGQREQAEKELHAAYYSGGVLPTAMCYFVLITARSEDPDMLRKTTTEYNQAFLSMFDRNVWIQDIAQRFSFQLEDPGTAMGNALMNIINAEQGGSSPLSR
jgi:hypothetical protein